ncbi:glucosyl-3-phosphoglycerate synthase [Corynebacterium deserti GIMN1.010]|uniref:Glucosyl-3-phosphoglycerate synthase n=1 Tax=Corynebacterium deserti GIMN1.010 TaxID=931089 RepID=A0A0M3Q9F0_9CORY|nr:glucosyl-3-phosphoglycerate synthase [Corynebacterium deserti]ALC05513.1 glucosyl-3-phosphoglycerate synthase [Corynebacterium deserti GIMN1.010]
MSVSVVIPALNEGPTVAQVVEAVLADDPLEVLVIDADSTDNTAFEAARAGATVLNWREILGTPTIPGKGESLWRGVAAARGDIVAFVDADLTSFRPGMITKLVAPFADESIHLVKADYVRTFGDHTTGGGRVTELTAKPLLRMLFPELAHIRQPLGGEYAIRRSTALTLPFVAGYGVEVGLLIDVASHLGTSSIAQVDLGTRSHNHQSLEALSSMADVVAATILNRFGHDIDVLQRDPLD